MSYLFEKFENIKQNRVKLSDYSEINFWMLDISDGDSFISKIFKNIQNYMGYIFQKFENKSQNKNQFDRNRVIFQK